MRGGSEQVKDASSTAQLTKLRVVHRLTAALRTADSPLDFYGEAVAVVVALLGVDRAALLLFDPDGIMRFKAWLGLSREYRQAVEGHTPWSRADVEAQPILVPDVDEDEEFAVYGPVFRAEGIRALAFVPLVHDRRLVGKFMLYYSRPHAFTGDEVAVAEILAAHVALALERRQAEEDLRRQQEHLQLALAAGEMGTWDWDVPAGTVAWSPTLEALHGLQPGSFAGTFEAFQADIHPDDRARVVGAIQAVLDASAGDTYAITYRIIRPDGTLRCVSASGQVLRDEEGRAQRMLGVCGDVTERERLLEAERDSAARLASLQRVTAELSRAVTVADVAGVVLGLALRELGARSGSLCMREGDQLAIIDAFGYDGDVMGHWGSFPLGAELPASEAVRTGQAVFLRSSAERTERYPVFATSPVVGDEAFAMVPLIDGEPIGCLVLGFAKAREFSADDERFYGTVAGQCAGALVRARLYEEAEQAREAAERSRDRLAFLSELSTALSASLDQDETLRRLADRLVPELADWSAVYLLEDSRVVPVAIAHRDPGQIRAARDLLDRYPVSLADPHGVGAVIRTGSAEALQPVTDAVLAASAREPDHLERLRNLGLGAAVAVPLSARGKVIGAVALVNSPGRDLDDILSLAEAVAARAATAIENARLFQQRTEIARTLQASLLPPELPHVPGLDLAARYVAGSAGIDVGGDFYDVFHLDDHRLVAVVGDVCGRGVGAATLASLSRHAIRSAAITTRHPIAILSHLNEILLRHEPEGDGYEPRFCTALVAVIDPDPDGSATMSLAIGGHPLPLLRSADGTVRPVGAPGSLIGVLPDLDVTASVVRLAPGDALVCFTDGVTERRAAEHFFGDGFLLETVAGAHGDADALAGAVEGAVSSFAAGDLTDDMAVLVLRAVRVDAAQHAGSAEPTSATIR